MTQGERFAAIMMELVTIRNNTNPKKPTVGIFGTPGPIASGPAKPFVGNLVRPDSFNPINYAKSMDPTTGKPFTPKTWETFYRVC